MIGLGSLRAAYQRFSTPGHQQQTQREFLPAALEVIETPPSPTGRGLGLMIMLFFGLAVAWAFIGKVDVEASAHGRIIPSGDVKTIQPLDPGVVRAIHVQDGDHVKAGQLLLELDPTVPSADQTRLSSDLMRAKLDVARLTALKVAYETGRAPVFSAPAGAPAALVEEARTAMSAQADQESARLADLTQQIAQKDAERGEVAAQIAELSATTPMLADKERIHRELRAQGYGTTLAYLDAQQQLAAARHETIVEAQRQAQAEAARDALVAQRRSVHSQYGAELLADLRKAQQQESELSQQLIQATSKTAQTELRSPISGVVEELSVHTLNGVVTPAQHLMTIVPDGSNLMIESRLENHDVGFVHAGQPVKIKIDTYNFTRYGILDGRVLSVSRDVVGGDENRPQAPQNPAAPQPAPAPSYVARIALPRTEMMIDGQLQQLRPGMAVTTEIRTGQRTIIDYLLSPLARKTDESLHER
ncbi:MAG TPA: HlyD family type I secretion periplasmic adaptor subunit [Caulobacteraceae bacterium]|jgi:hemolysin D|nr:HlyD family type I secretion periplasmic adaptor subunit [Caulobacteraceae bacterium]